MKVEQIVASVLETLGEGFPAEPDDETAWHLTHEEMVKTIKWIVDLAREEETTEGLTAEQRREIAEHVFDKCGMELLASGLRGMLGEDVDTQATQDLRKRYGRKGRS